MQRVEGSGIRLYYYLRDRAIRGVYIRGDSGTTNVFSVKLSLEKAVLVRDVVVAQEKYGREDGGAAGLFRRQLTLTGVVCLPIAAAVPGLR